MPSDSQSCHLCRADPPTSRAADTSGLDSDQRAVQRLAAAAEQSCSTAAVHARALACCQCVDHCVDDSKNSQTAKRWPMYE